MSIRRVDPMVKYLTGFVMTIYLLGALGFGGNHYFGHPERSFFDAVVHGLAWGGVFVEMARSP